MRATECFSIYSDISRRTIALSSSNRNPAKALVNSVFPTPVGPRKRKLPIGWSTRCRPALERRTALETASIASCCPITRSPRAPSIFSNLSFSPCIMRSTGIPVQRLTTAAISFSRTSSLIMEPVSSSTALVSAIRFSKTGIILCANSPARVQSPSRCACSKAIRALSSSSVSFWPVFIFSFSSCHCAVSSADSASSSFRSSSSFSKRSRLASSFSCFRASRSIFI